MSSYDAETINSKNRNRIERSIELVKPRLKLGKILDYGCGPGVFVAQMLALEADSAVGYEPFMEERTRMTLPIYETLDEVKKRGPYETVTLFETIEHLSQAELDGFLGFCKDVMSDHAALIVSAPIERWGVEVLSYGPLPLGT